MMKTLYLLLACLTLVTAAWAQELYFPPADNTNEWSTLDPASLGWCSDSIEALYNFLEIEQTKSFIILKDGQIVLEQYFGTYVQDSIYPWFSAGKSLRSVLIGIAEDEGALNLDDPTSDYLGAGWTSLFASQEENITIWNQITMTTGLNEIFFTCTDPSCLIYLAEPGARWAYHNSPYSLTKEVLEAATNTPLNTYTNSRIEAKLGSANGFWVGVGDNTFYLSKARDMARFGLMVQAGGTWDGETVIGNTAYFEAMLQPSQELNPSYGYLWWLNGQESVIGPDSPISIDGPMAPDAPLDAVTAAGAQGQFISISNEEGLIMIRQGASNNESLAPTSLLNEIWKRVMRLACSPTSVAEAEAVDINIYPNPVADKLYFNSPMPLEEVRLFDSAGSLVLEAANVNEIDVSKQPAGMYWVVLRNSQGVVQKKVVVK